MSKRETSGLRKADPVDEAAAPVVAEVAPAFEQAVAPGTYVIDGADEAETFAVAQERAGATVQVEQMPSGTKVRQGAIYGRYCRPEDADSEAYLRDGWRVAVE